MIRETTLTFPLALRARWPSPLAAEWLASYPSLFEAQDFEQTLTQPTKHFFEWLAAVHLHQRDGVFALIEKYGYGNHPRKVAALDRILGAGADIVRSLRPKYGVQPPDLLVYTPDCSRYWFVEAKGPTDSVRSTQDSSYQILQDALGADIEVVHFIPSPNGSVR